MSVRIGLAGYAARRLVEDCPQTVFDRGAAAKLIIEGRTGPLSIHLVIDGRPVTLRTRSERLGTERACLYLEPPDDLCGSGSLEVAPTTGPAHAWPVLWRRSPMKRPTLQAIQHALAEGDTSQALARLNAAITVDHETTFWLAFVRGRVDRHLGAWREAAGHWRAAADLALNGHWTSHGARALRAAAFMLWRFGHLDEADALLKRVRDLDRSTDDIEGRPNTQYYLGLVASSRSAYADALNHLRAARDAVESLGRPLTFLHPAFAMVCLEVGEYAQATRHAQALAQDIDEDALGAHDVIAGYLSAGWVLLQTARRSGDTEAHEAMTLFERAEAVIARIPDPMPRVTLNLNRAWQAWWADDIERTSECIETARSIAGDISSDSEAERNQLELALLGIRVDLAHGDSKSATTRAERLLDHALRTTSGVPSTLSWAARHALGQAALGAGSDAGSTLLEAAFDDLRTVSLALDRRDLGRFFGERPQVCDPTELFDDLVDAAYANGDLARAFHWAHAAHVLHRRAHDLPKMLEHLPDEARRAWRLVGEQLAACREQYDALLDDWRLTPSIRDARLAETGHGIRQLLDQRLRIVDRHAELSGPPLAAVIAHLRSDEALALLRARASGGIEVWWLGAKGATRTITTAVGAHIAERLGDRTRLVVVADHPSGGWSLPTFSRDGTLPLGARVAFSFVPHLGLLTTADATPPERSAIIADPRLDLPHAHRDAERLLEWLPSPIALSGRMATRAAVLDELERCDLFHFSGHGEADPDEPESIYLRLAGGDTLRASDILAQGTRPTRVVLNGCQTGRAVAEQAMSLPAAFLMAGSRSVLATVAPIDDAAASRFIRRFYAEGGASDPASAMVAATRASIDEGSDIWSAYRLIGRS